MKKKPIGIFWRTLCAAAALAAAQSANALKADETIWDDRPGTDWESTWYPLGNGRLGCMVDGGARKLRVQFNVDSLWTGGENVSTAVSDAESEKTNKSMGAYQNFGELEIELPELPEGEVTEYARALKLNNGVYKDTFRVGGRKLVRCICASKPDDAIFIAAGYEGKVGPAPDGPSSARLTLKGAHSESVAPVVTISSISSRRLPLTPSGSAQR